MAVQNPPIFHSSGSHAVAPTRRMVGSISSDRGGVVLANDLKIVAPASPAMTVSCSGGRAFIQGTEGAYQGSYHVDNQGDITGIVIGAMGGTTRTDTVVARVRDYQFGAGGLPSTAFAIEVVQGTPGAGAPSIPTASNSFIPLADIVMPPSTTAINAGMVVDRRRWAMGTAGLIPATSANRPTASGEPTMIYETDTNDMYVSDGAAWVPHGTNGAWKPWTPTVAAGGGGVANALGNGTVSGTYTQVGKTVHWHVRIVFGSTTVVGDSVFEFTMPVSGKSNALQSIGAAELIDATGSIYPASVYAYLNSMLIYSHQVSGTAIYVFPLRGAVPFPWAAGDAIVANGTYEAA